MRDMTLDGNKNDDDIGGDMEDEMHRAGGTGNDDDDEDEEAADMEDFEESGMLDAVDPVSSKSLFRIKLSVFIQFI